jgi:hypothetical protein
MVGCRFRPLPHPRPAARRICRTKAGQGFQIIAWPWLWVSAIRSLALPVSDRWPRFTRNEYR